MTNSMRNLHLHRDQIYLWPHCLGSNTKKIFPVHNILAVTNWKCHIQLRGTIQNKVAFIITYHSEFLRCVSFPNSQVHFIRSTDNVFIVQRPCYCHHSLHTLCMVNFPGRHKQQVHVTEMSHKFPNFLYIISTRQLELLLCRARPNSPVYSQAYTISFIQLINVYK